MTETIDTNIDEYVPEIHNAKGGIKPLDSFDPADLARMSDTRRELFYSAHKAASECKEVEDAARLGEIDIRQATKDLSNKRAAMVAAIPVHTAFDEYKRIVKKIRPPEPSPEAKTAAALAKAQYREAEEFLNALRERVKLYHDAIPEARKFAAQSWARYYDKYPPKSDTQVRRETLARQLERRRNGTDQPQTQETQPQCALDAYMMGGKGPIGIRSARQAHRHPNGPSGGPTYPANMLNQRVAPPKVAPWNIKPRGAA